MVLLVVGGVVGVSTCRVTAPPFLPAGLLFETVLLRYDAWGVGGKFYEAINGLRDAPNGYFERHFVNEEALDGFHDEVQPSHRAPAFQLSNPSRVHLRFLREGTEVRHICC